MRDPHRREIRGRVRVIDTTMADGYDPPSMSLATPTTPLDRYLAATQAWRDANAATERATMQRAYALADMAASMDVPDVARTAGLSVARAEQLIAKARQEDAT